MTLTAERSIQNAWTGNISPDPFLPSYELGEDPGPEGGLHSDTVKSVVILDPSTGVASIRVLMGFSAAAIPAEEDWVQTESKFYLFSTDSGTDTILMDIPEAEGASDSEPDEYHQVIEQLRTRGREIVAEDLVELLHNIQEDPEDDVEIQLHSLQSMARFLIEHGGFADPLAGPDPEGLMQIEWRIFGDGLLVMAFLEDEYIHCVAQAESPASTSLLDVSVELPMEQVAKEYGYLVPRR